jgi:hypothetical protein
MEKSGNAMEGFLYRLLPPRAFAAGLPRHRLEPSALVPQRRASRVNYARLSGRVAHIGGFAVIGKGRAISYQTGMSELRLTFAPDEDGNDYGWLDVSVRADGFIAHAGTLVRTDQLADFAGALATYPIGPDAGITLATKITGDDVRITVVPLNSRGHLEVSVALSHHGQQLTQTAKISVVSDYADLETFRLQLTRIIAGEQIEATLRAHR